MSLGLTTRDIGAVWDLVTPHSHLMNSAFFFFLFPISWLITGERAQPGKVGELVCGMRAVRI